MITSVDIQEQGFGTARNGYDMQEVDVFLEHVAHEIDQMQADFEDQLQEARQASTQVVADDPAKDDEIRRLRDTVTALQARLSEQHTSESVISDAFIAAQKAANKIKDDARAEAENTIKAAQEKANKIVGEAADEKQRIIDEIGRLDKSRTDFVEEYSALIKRFSDEATKTFTRAGLNPDSSIRSAHEPLRSFGTAPSASDAAVRPADQMPTPKADANDTLYGAVNNIDVEGDLD